MDCAGIDGIIVVNLVGKNIACCEVDKRGDARDALMGECVGLVEIETEWNLKIFLLDGRLKLDSVEIETEWNLKAYQINLGRWPRKVEIETEWNLKSFDIFQVDRPTLVEIETEWNLKA